MAGPNNNYPNTKVIFPQGADRIYFDSDGLFDFFGTTVRGDVLKKYLYSNHVKTSIRSSAVVLSTVNLPQNGIVFLNLSETCSNISAWAPACSVGDELTIILLNYTGESVLSVKISGSGATFVGRKNSVVSNIGLHTSNLSEGILKLKCFTDGAWTVVGGNSRQISERGDT